MLRLVDPIGHNLNAVLVGIRLGTWLASRRTISGLYVGHASAVWMCEIKYRALPVSFAGTTRPPWALHLTTAGLAGGRSILVERGVTSFAVFFLLALFLAVFFADLLCAAHHFFWAGRYASSLLLTDALSVPLS